jgi:hypothetical protein
VSTGLRRRTEHHDCTAERQGLTQSLGGPQGGGRNFSGKAVLQTLTSVTTWSDELCGAEAGAGSVSPPSWSREFYALDLGL